MVAVYFFRRMPIVLSSGTLGSSDAAIRAVGEDHMSVISSIKVLCVDDHPVVREGIALMLEDHPPIRLVATAATGREALTRFSEYSPDITLMDLRLPDCHGVDVIRKIMSIDDRARIIALTTYSGDAQALAALKAGAMGFLLKTALRLELLDAIKAVHRGQRRICAEIAGCLAENAAQEGLSTREIEVLRGLSAGTRNKIIAAELSISEETVKGHMKSVFQKLNVDNRTQAVVIAMQRGLLGV